MKRLLTGLMSLLPERRAEQFEDFMSWILNGWFDDVVVTPYLFVQDMGEFDPLPAQHCTYEFIVEVRAVPWIGRPVIYEMRLYGGSGIVEFLPRTQRKEFRLNTHEAARRCAERLAVRGFRSTVRNLEQRGGFMDYLWSLSPNALA